MTETNVGGVAADRLRSYIERWERIEEQKRELAADQKEIMAEAKSAGFDVKVMKSIIADRKKAAAEVEEFETVKDVYRHALGMMADTPLGEAAIERTEPKRTRVSGVHQVKQELGGGTLTISPRVNRSEFGRDVGRKLIEVFTEDRASQ